jgi:exopolyphosphatase/guanosine-5'-triphosphate,3'-diphosphate pyrophosphatase
MDGEERRGPVRVAGVDMGSNTTRLIVADVERAANGTLTHRAIERATTITRLAEQVDARGILLPQAIARTRNALAEYRATARRLGAVFVLATATSAVRDADNGEAFLGEVEYSYGFRARLLDGDDEAAATWSGVTSDPSLAARARQGSGLLLDIGGGSTEVVLTSDGEITDRHSFQLGSVRLTERLLATEDPPSTDAYAAAVDAAREQLESRFPTARTPDLAIGVAGTVTTIAAVNLGLVRYDRDVVHGSSISSQDAVRVRERLRVLRVDARAQVAGLEPKRAPVILGGIAVLEAVLAHFGIATMTVSDADILDGIALMAGQIALDEDIRELVEPFGRTVC